MDIALVGAKVVIEDHILYPPYSDQVVAIHHRIGLVFEGARMSYRINLSIEAVYKEF
jgi:hypothetical protein